MKWRIFILHPFVVFSISLVISLLLALLAPKNAIIKIWGDARVISNPITIIWLTICWLSFGAGSFSENSLKPIILKKNNTNKEIEKIIRDVSSSLILAYILLMFGFLGTVYIFWLDSKNVGGFLNGLNLILINAVQFKAQTRLQLGHSGLTIFPMLIPASMIWIFIIKGLCLALGHSNERLLIVSIEKRINNLLVFSIFASIIRALLSNDKITLFESLVIGFLAMNISFIVYTVSKIEFGQIELKSTIAEAKRIGTIAIIIIFVLTILITRFRSLENEGITGSLLSYFASLYRNVDTLVSECTQYTWGLASVPYISEIATSLKLNNVIESNPFEFLDDLVHKYIPATNAEVLNLFAVSWLDFGMLGWFNFYILGFISSYIFRITICKRSLFYIGIYSIILGSLYIVWYSFYLKLIRSAIIIIVLFFLSRYMRIGILRKYLYITY